MVKISSLGLLNKYEPWASHTKEEGFKQTLDKGLNLPLGEGGEETPRMEIKIKSMWWSNKGVVTKL